MDGKAPEKAPKRRPLRAPEVDAYGAVAQGLIHREISAPTALPAQWGSELDDPVLGPKIALAAEEAMKSIKAWRKRHTSELSERSFSAQKSCCFPSMSHPFLMALQ